MSVDAVRCRMLPAFVHPSKKRKPRKSRPRSKREEGDAAGPAAGAADEAGGAAAGAAGDEAAPRGDVRCGDANGQGGHQGEGEGDVEDDEVEDGEVEDGAVGRLKMADGLDEGVGSRAANGEEVEIGEDDEEVELTFGTMEEVSSPDRGGSAGESPCAPDTPPSSRKQKQRAGAEAEAAVTTRPDLGSPLKRSRRGAPE